MKWSHESVYSVLFAHPNFSVGGINDLYVCITQNQVAKHKDPQMKHSMILYGPNSVAKSRPYHYRSEQRESFNSDLHERLKPIIDCRNRGGEKKEDKRKFFRCKIVDWDLFAKHIGLEDITPKY